MNNDSWGFILIGVLAGLFVALMIHGTVSFIRMLKQRRLDYEKLDGSETACEPPETKVTNARVVSKRVGMKGKGGYKSPSHHRIYFVTFLTEEGESLELAVNKENFERLSPDMEDVLITEDGKFFAFGDDKSQAEYGEKDTSVKRPEAVDGYADKLKGYMNFGIAVMAIVLCITVLGIVIVVREYHAYDRAVLITVFGVLALLGSYFSRVHPYLSDIRKGDYIEYKGSFFVEDIGSSFGTDYIVIKTEELEYSGRYKAPVLLDNIDVKSNYKGSFVYANSSNAIVDIKIKEN